MDIIKEFEKYLPKWAERKMWPVPKKEQAERWNMAWADFVKEVLQGEKRDELVADYKAMKFKRKGKPVVQEIEEVVEEVIEEKPLSDWEKVQQLLDLDP